MSRRKQQMYQDEYDDEDDYGADYDDYGADELSDDYDDVASADGYGDEASDEFVGGDLNADQYDPNKEEHIKQEQLHRVQTVVFSYGLSDSMDMLHRNRHMLVNRMSVGAEIHLKDNTSLTNRSVVTDENTRGNTSRIILVGAEQVYVNNAYPRGWKYTVNEKLLVPNTHHVRTGEMCTGVIGAGATMSTRRNIFFPNDIVTIDLLKKWERCDPEMVDDQFMEVDGKTFMRTRDKNGDNSVAVDLLERNPEAFPGFNLKAALRNELKDIPFTEIPSDISKEMIPFMKSEINNIASRMSGPDHFSVKWAPADGKDLNSASNLVGETTALVGNKQTECRKMVQNAHFENQLDIEFKYIILP